MPNETGGPWVMGEPAFNRAEHKCVDGTTKYFRADNCVACLTARLAEAEAAARFYARYYDGPSEALLGEADRKAFQWIERAEKAGGWPVTPSAKLKQLWDARIARIVQERDEARAAARILFDELSLFTRTEWLMERWPWLSDEAFASTTRRKC